MRAAAACKLEPAARLQRRSRVCRDADTARFELNIRRRTMMKTSTEESRMDDEGEEGDELRGSTAPKSRRRMVTKTRLEENNSNARMVAVTTQESLDGIREKAMRIASFDEISARRCPVQGGLRTLWVQ